MQDYKPLRAFDVRVNESPGSLLLVQGMEAYELGDVESFIWRICDGDRTTAEIAAEVAGEFGSNTTSRCRTCRRSSRSCAVLGLLE